MIAGYAGGVSGARRAALSGASVVVVDALRASATIAVLVSQGAKVFPLASIEEAASFPADFHVGERGGAKVEGFDFGNSPTEVLEAGMPSGAAVAMSTTNGTRIVEAAEGAPAILAGCFVNAGAVARWLTSDPATRDVMVVGCGWRGGRASEDEDAAGAILGQLESLGAALDERAMRVVQNYKKRSPGALTDNSAARRLKRLGYERDLEFCLVEDTVPVAPVLVDGAFTA